MGNRLTMANKLFISGIIAASLLLLFQSTSSAGVYKWVDKNGQVHYGAHPGNMEAEKMTIRQNETTKPRSIQNPDENDENPDGETTEETTTEPATKPAKPKQPEISAKDKRRFCKEATGDIASINSRGRMREISKTGEYTYLTEQQRQQRLSAAKKKQRTYCK